MVTDKAGVLPTDTGLPWFTKAGPVLTAPARLGIYEIRELVVTSSFSRLYRAHDPLLDRWVAIKVFDLSPEKEASLPYDRQEWQRRFVAEARILAAMDHPHVVRVDAMGHLPDGAPYMVMPWHVANLRREIGRDVFDPERQKTVPVEQRPRAVAPERAIEILRQTCLGLAALHRRGIVHRDVKPSNLLLTERHDGMIRLCDLGMAKQGADMSRSRAGVWIGTLDYLAPEQRENAAAATDRADVYAVGVLAYRLLTGKLPVGAFAPVSTLVEGVGTALDHWVGDALAPDPVLRPPAIRMAARLAQGVLKA